MITIKGRSVNRALYPEGFDFSLMEKEYEPNVVLNYNNLVMDEFKIYDPSKIPKQKPFDLTRVYGPRDQDYKDIAHKKQ